MNEDRKRHNAGVPMILLTGARPLITVAALIILSVLWSVFDAAQVYGSPPAETPIPTAAPDCLQCHPKTLKAHDELGSGSKACLICHDSDHMGTLRLLAGTQLSLSDSSQLCGQCHANRYEQWKEGTHGVSGPEDAECTECHDPHQPQVALTGITVPHPPATSPPPESPTVPIPLLAAGVSAVAAIVVLVVWKRTAL